MWMHTEMFRQGESDAKAKKLFDGYWNTEDFDVQNAYYVSGCVKVADVKRRYTLTIQARLGPVERSIY